MSELTNVDVFCKHETKEMIHDLRSNFLEEIRIGENDEKGYTLFDLLKGCYRLLMEEKS